MFYLFLFRNEADCRLDKAIEERQWLPLAVQANWNSQQPSGFCAAQQGGDDCQMTNNKKYIN